MIAPRNPNLIDFADRVRALTMIEVAHDALQRARRMAARLAAQCGLDEHDDAITDAIFNSEDPGEALRALMRTEGKGPAPTDCTRKAGDCP